jgi:hypothetical protein
MKSSRKVVKKEEKEKKAEKRFDDRYITCPSCRATVSYERRGKHHCFRKHLMEVEREIARMGWANVAR